MMSTGSNAPQFGRRVHSYSERPKPLESGKTTSKVRLRARCAHRQDYKCMYCGVTMTKANTMLPTSCTLEHIVPMPIVRVRVFLGVPTQQDYGAACRKCNGERGHAFHRFVQDFPDCFVAARKATQRTITRDTQ